MRLTANNIRCVKALTKNGLAYCFHVVMKSGYVSDSREYAYYDERGRITGDKEFPLYELPKTVSQFVLTHRPILERYDEYNDYDIAVYRFE